MNARFVAPGLLAFSFAACSSSPPYAAQSIEDDAEMESHVVVTDLALYDVIRAGKPRLDRVANTNQLHVVVPLRNIDDEEIRILAQMEFQDSEKQSIGDSTNRQVQIIPPGGTIQFEATSKLGAAADWLLRLSWNK